MFIFKAVKLQSYPLLAPLLNDAYTTNTMTLCPRFWVAETLLKIIFIKFSQSVPVQFMYVYDRLGKSCKILLHQHGKTRVLPVISPSFATWAWLCLHGLRSYQGCDTLQEGSRCFRHFYYDSSALTPLRKKTITNSVLNRPDFPQRCHAKRGLFKSELVIVKIFFKSSCCGQLWV